MDCIWIGMGMEKINKIRDNIRKMKKHLDDYDILRQKIDQINKIVREERRVWNRLKDEEKFFIIKFNFLLGMYQSEARLDEDRDGK